MPETMNEALAKLIARDIFECGDNPNDKCQRIEFKGGEYPGKETAMGGCCETSLAGLIAKSLKKHTESQD